MVRILLSIAGGSSAMLGVVKRRIRSQEPEPEQAGRSSGGILSGIMRADFLRWLLAVILTYACVTVAFIIFRADSLTDVVAYAQGIAALRGGVPLRDLALIVILVVLLAPLEFVQYTNKDQLLAVRGLLLPLRGLLYAIMVLGLLLASSSDIPFIYFQF